MGLMESLRRPMGGFMVNRGEQRAEAARSVADRFSQQLDHKLNIEFGRLTRRMEIFMGNVQARLREVIEVVKSQNTKIDSLNTLMDGLRNEVKRLLTNGNTDDTTMALVDQLFEEAKRNSEKIDEALAENQEGDPLPLRPISNTIEADAAAKAEEAAKAAQEAERLQKESEDAAAKVKAQQEADAKAAEEAAKSDTSGAPPGPANSVAENAKGNTDQTPPFAADKTEGSTDARDLRPDIADPALGDPGGNLQGGARAGSYNQQTGQFDTAGRPPVMNPATGQPVPGIVGGAPPSDTGNKDLTMPADAGYLGASGDPATSPPMQQGLSGTGGASNTSDPNSGHQANVAMSNAPEPPVAADNAIGDEPLKDPRRPVGPVDQNRQPFDEVEAKRKAEQGV